MKSFLRKSVLFVLKKLALHRLKKFKGKIIAVTGSIGKTSTKEAIFTVLNAQMKVRRNKKSMNSEFGVLLTLLEIDSGFSSAVKWTWLLFKAFYNALLPDLSDVLLLEMGVDKPGDMDYLTSIIKPDIAVLTNINPVHLSEGQFKNLEEIFNEKSKLLQVLNENGTAILNIDDKFIAGLVNKLSKKEAVTFGKGADAEFHFSRVSSSLDGTDFTLEYKGKTYKFHARVLGDFQPYILMPAIICALKLGMNMEQIAAGVEKYVLPPGRMSLIEGLNGSVILDSSYNSSPEALKEALKILGEVGEKKRKVAVLGNMNELGEHSKKMHEAIGEIVPKYVDLLITVGDNAKLIAEKAMECGLEGTKIFKFETARQAASFFKDEVSGKDVILVKGSQNKVRLEQFVKELMAHPELADQLLVRQEKVWQKI